MFSSDEVYQKTNSLCSDIPEVKTAISELPFFWSGINSEYSRKDHDVFVIPDPYRAFRTIRILNFFRFGQMTLRSNMRLCFFCIALAEIESFYLNEWWNNAVRKKVIILNRWTPNYMKQQIMKLCRRSTKRFGDLLFLNGSHFLDLLLFNSIKKEMHHPAAVYFKSGYLIWFIA